jgi:hypothetical protein
MADKQLSELTEAGALTGAALLYLVDEAGNSRKVSLSALAQWIREEVQGSVLLADSGELLFGLAGVDGSWRLVRSGDNLNIERREAGVWVNKMTVDPSGV